MPQDFINTAERAVDAISKNTLEMKSNIYAIINNSIYMDLVFWENHKDLSRIIEIPLWDENNIPPNFSAKWEVLKSKLISSGEDWEVWTNWYEDRLAGNPANPVLDVARVTLPEPMWEEGAATVNAEIKNLTALFDQGGEEAVTARMAELQQQYNAGQEEVDLSNLPRAWFLQYVPGQEGESWTQAATPGAQIRWKTKKALPIAMQAGDPVVYWRSVHPTRKSDRGGIVGVGRVTSTDLTPEGDTNRFPTEVIIFNETRCIDRDTAIGRAGLSRKAWQGAVLDIPPEEALRLHKLLMDFEFPGLFSKDELENAGLEDERPDEQASQAAETSTQVREKTETHFTSDDAETERDDLGRGVLAIALARRLHRIWCQLNQAEPRERSRQLALSEADDASAAKRTVDRSPSKDTQDSFFDRSRQHTRAAFVLHLDAPWGGGKTTFANFLSRVLNPSGYSHGKASFLRRRYADKDLSTVFLEDYDAISENQKDWPEDARRPWIIVNFNAWQAEHVSPPWWAFYQTIRKRCFTSVRREGTMAFSRSDQRPPHARGEMPRWGQWFLLCLHEFVWRIFNPGVLALLSTAAVSALLLWICYGLGIVGVSGAEDKEKLGFFLGNSIGVILAGLTGISLFWSISSVITNSLRPGSNSLAERLALGNGDPFERFRRHFYRTMERVKRPVLVVVDDLDRCKPEFVVDLVRGMQTLLRSPRVVFVVLGDRDWIERAFEAHHKSMNAVHVGKEQTFGARFVEKAIQMSFILPGMTGQAQQNYVRRLLLGTDGAIQAPSGGRSSSDGHTPLPEAQASPETAAMIRDAFQRVVQTNPTVTELETADLRSRVRAEIQQGSPITFSAGADLPAGTDFQLDEGVLDRQLKDELTIHTATATAAEVETRHRLESIAASLPANPRQIKRIINAVTIYSAVARRERTWAPDSPRWLQLARWIVLMTEWPHTWRVLSSHPIMADLVHAGDPAATLKMLRQDPLQAAELNFSDAACLEEINRLRADASLMTLISGTIEGAEPSLLDKEAILDLSGLTPLTGREVPLSEQTAEDGDGDD